MTFLTAARFGVDAAVVYHGGDTEKYLGEVDRLYAPLLMHLAEEDEFISKPAQTEIKKALANKPNVTVWSYPCSGDESIAGFEYGLRNVSAQTARAAGD